MFWACDEILWRLIVTIILLYTHSIYNSYKILLRIIIYNLYLFDIRQPSLKRGAWKCQIPCPSEVSLNAYRHRRTALSSLLWTDIPFFSESHTPYSILLYRSLVFILDSACRRQRWLFDKHDSICWVRVLANHET